MIRILHLLLELINDLWAPPPTTFVYALCYVWLFSFNSIIFKLNKYLEGFFSVKLLYFKSDPLFWNPQPSPVMMFTRMHKPLSESRDAIKQVTGLQ